MRLYQAPQIFPGSMTTEDRRGYYAVLTEEGRRLFARAQPIHRRDIQEHYARHLSDADVQALTQIICKVRQAIQPSTE